MVTDGFRVLRTGSFAVEDDRYMGASLDGGSNLTRGQEVKSHTGLRPHLQRTLTLGAAARFGLAGSARRGSAVSVRQPGARGSAGRSSPACTGSAA